MRKGTDSCRAFLHFFYAVFFTCIFVVPAFADTFTENFESGIGNWYADNGVWEVGIPTAGPESCYSGQQCAGTILEGDYPGHTDSRLISPSILLPEISGAEEIHLRFWHWFSYSSYDSGQVQISVYDDSSGWSDFEPIGTQIAQVSLNWTLKSVDLTPYALQRVRIAFSHVAGRDTLNHASESTGWYIDDVQITGPLGIWLVDFDSDGDGVPDSSDQCPGTLTGDCVNSVGCNTQGTYTQEQVDQMIAAILAWGDMDGDGRIGLEEAIHALQVTSGFNR